MTRYCDDCANHICTLLGRCERQTAQGMSAGLAKTPQAVEGEARQPGREAMRPNTNSVLNRGEGE